MAVDRRVEAQTRRLKRRQHAAAHREQLCAAGWTAGQIRSRVARGEWQHPFHSVYVLGDAGLIPFAMESAVLLSLGAESVLSHRTAGFLWGLTAPRPLIVEVTIPRSKVRPRTGVRLHLIHSLDAKDVRYQHALRVTSPARTIVDLATESSSSELEHATGDAVATRLMTDHDLEHALERAPRNHPGAARLRARLAHDPEFLLQTRSVAERVAYPLIIAAGLPRPILNDPIGRYTVDLHWPQYKLIVEVDSFQFHGSRHAFETDRKRDQILTALGYTVIRITWHQLQTEPYRVIATIAQALARAGSHAQAA